MVKITTNIIILLMASLHLAGQDTVSATFKKEILPSGLTCYFVKTDAPVVDYYLIQNTGSALERENENGLAHFIEHLSFLSTRHFDRPISTFLKEHHIENNASTYQDKIIYYMKGVEPENVTLNDSCLLILHDWCGFLALKEPEVEKEKRVILEEWRSGNRLAPADLEYAKLLYNNTRLARLSGLGNMDFIGSVEIPALRTFCEKWFNPALAAIVVKGNIDAEATAARVKELFRDVEVAPGYEVRPPVVIPDDDTLRFKRVAVPNDANTITFAMRMKDNFSTDIATFCRERFYAQLYKQLMEMRLTRYRDSDEGELHRFRVEYGTLTKGYKQLHLEVTPFEHREIKVVKQLMGFHYDLLYNGLSDSELEDLKTGYPYRFLLQKESLDYAGVVEDNFIKQYPLFTPEEYNRIVRATVTDFSNDGFIRFCRQNLLRQPNRILFAYGMEKSVFALPQKTLEKIVTDDSARSRNPETTPVVFDPSALKKDARVVSEETATDGQTTVWHFSNGATLVYRRTGEPLMHLNAYSKGGFSAFTAWDRPVGEAMLPVAELSGTEKYNRDALERFKYANGIQFAWTMGETDESIQLSFPEASFVPALQLLCLKLQTTIFQPETPGRMDKVGYELAARQLEEDDYKNRLDKELYGKGKPVGRITRTYFQNVTADKLRTAFERKFRNASDWVYVLTGNLEPADVKEKLTPYLGSLPSETSRDIFVNNRKWQLKKSVTREVIYNTPDNNGGTDMNYVYAKPLTGNERIQLELLTNVLRNRFNWELRDKKAAIYGMYMACRSHSFPDQISVININFGSKKEDQQPIAEYISREIKNIGQKGVTADELIRAKKQFDGKKFAAENFQTLCRETYFRSPAEIAKLPAPEELAGITPESIRKFARKFQAGSLVVRFVFK